MSFSDRKLSCIHLCVSLYVLSFTYLFYSLEAQQAKSLTCQKRFSSDPEDVWLLFWANRNSRWSPWFWDILDFFSRTTVCQVIRLARNVPSSDPEEWRRVITFRRNFMSNWQTWPLIGLCNFYFSCFQELLHAKLLKR